ncbi:MAG: anthranilate synthase component I [Desulfatiglans sp.]|jgi:anthranilate synthase component 1|nr:anthranilate synthase component I [Thermodesulfobacteriota bacterium]MEE4351909.1 anthranilate synthase component I [Desulfatiglans sp.]
MEIKPTLSEFKQMAGLGNIIPVYKEYLADTETPVSAYLKIQDKDYSYLLESADGGERWGRYSFIGFKPNIIVSSKNGDVDIWNRTGKRKLLKNQNPLYTLRVLSRHYKPVTSKDLAPFQGGLVGFFNYDLVRTFERLPSIVPNEPGLPECIFTASQRLIIFDHFTHKIKVVAFADLEQGKSIEDAYLAACQEVDETMEELQRPLAGNLSEGLYSLSDLESNFSKEDFKEAVRRAKEYIVAGDIIQVVLSQRFSGEVSGDDFTLYRKLRSVNPSPYMFYLNFGETKLIGASPEILVRLTDGKIELRPIAGTRPRGKTDEEDSAFEEELLEDPKERAEHIMLVDLGRNDVGKVATAGSVTVPRLMEIERYSHVMHIVSRVEGRMKPDMDAFELFASTFPAGTVSGAPKIRAMEIISELEPTARGPYAGAVGYFGFNGNMDFCITIRTIAIHQNRLSIQVGAGIVADSTPEGEYQETLRKGAAMFKAIGKEVE